MDLVQAPLRSACTCWLQVAGITYVRAWQGFAYVAFVTDVFSRRIVGRNVASTLRTEILRLEALDMALLAAAFPRRHPPGLNITQGFPGYLESLEHVVVQSFVADPRVLPLHERIEENDHFVHGAGLIVHVRSVIARAVQAGNCYVAMK